MKYINLLALSLAGSTSHAFLNNNHRQSLLITSPVSSSFSRRFAASGTDDDDDDAWDAGVDYDKELPASNDNVNPDPGTSWDDLKLNADDLKPKLGIGIDLEPMSKKEAETLKAEASEIINKKFDAGIQDIEKMRTRMNREMKKSREASLFASEMNAKAKSEELMAKIDKLTGNFLDSTEADRSSTKLAAAASKAMEDTGRGIEMGTWGTINGRTVIAEGVLGSVQDNVLQQERASKKTEQGSSTTADDESATQVATQENRIVLVADTNQDKMAKALVPTLVDEFEKTNIPNLQIDVVSPTATMPLGANDAACVLVFCTSLSQASSLKSILDRLLRKTLSGGKVGSPPTQLVGISTVGTERSDKFPYSMQNLLGKLDQRRQVEEVLINTVQNRVTEPPLDYTLIKMGESFKDGGNFELCAGDAVDDSTSCSTAAAAIVQAIALQPFARNATMSLTGSVGTSTDQEFWDTAFLPLEGPEVWRSEAGSIGDVSQYDQLVEYVREWATLLADQGKGLTTPVMAAEGILSRSQHLVKSQDGVRLLFLPTKTGKNYLSRGEEKQRENEVSSSSTTTVKNIMSRLKKEGGVDVVVEITKEEQLRVRARRCNYADDAVIKELSEETILKRLQEAITVWTSEHMA